MEILKRYISFIIFFSIIIAPSHAQNINQGKRQKDDLLRKITDIESRVREITIRDTTKGFSAPIKIDTAYANLIQTNVHAVRNRKGLLIVEPDWVPFSQNTTFRDTTIFDPAFLPPVFDGKILPDDLDFVSNNSTAEAYPPFHLISPDSTFAPALSKVRRVENLRRMYYMENPQKIKLNAMEFKGASVVSQEVVTPKNPFKELLSTEEPVTFTTPEVEKTPIHYLKWMKEIKGEHSMQLSQQSFSENWSGDNNLKLASYHKLTLNFKRKKLNVNNIIEWRLNMQKTPADTINEYNILDDYLRTYSTVSLQVKESNNWSYSTNLEMKTPLFVRNKAKDVKRTRERAFLSPFELNTGVGMRYELNKTSKKDKNRNFKLTADLSVFSLNYKYVRDEKVSVKQFGIEEDKSAKLEYGSTFNFNMTYNRNKYTKFTSRLKYFTNYEKAYAEWENNVNFVLNRYLSASLYLYVIYDDGVGHEKKDDKWGYFKYNQMVGFGLAYTW
ncbi:DUF3078 domain-containing protein [Dysgonomonas sp. 511]|uniref:DUF3078 domain-containing protein n=1 Tax=Dysgonomonas sp. 511 TaxID=2302930 RepID=UPI0013D58246|nr:DUF3078 domain-containing protein [Dysgonomonas sp. 511]NDV80189.1 DUF3078 domain-containing protein [Dysgonomonas sp. 511]